MPSLEKVTEADFTEQFEVMHSEQEFWAHHSVYSALYQELLDCLRNIDIALAEKKPLQQLGSATNYYRHLLPQLKQILTKTKEAS